MGKNRRDGLCPSRRLCSSDRHSKRNGRAYSGNAVEEKADHSSGKRLLPGSRRYRRPSSGWIACRRWEHDRRIRGRSVMKRMQLPDVRLKLSGNYRPKLFVVEYVSTKKGDAERGPLVRMRSSEARIRLIEGGTLVWVSGPRRQELAELQIDESIPEGHVFLRDIAGITVTEYV